MVDLSAFQLPTVLLPPSLARQAGRQEQRRVRAFLKGPVPMSWLVQASALGGSALSVGIGLWFYLGIQRDETVAVTIGRLATLYGISARTVQRGIQDLEQAGLIQVARPPGRKLVVRMMMRMHEGYSDD